MSIICVQQACSPSKGESHHLILSPKNIAFNVKTDEKKAIITGKQVSSGCSVKMEKVIYNPCF